MIPAIHRRTASGRVVGLERGRPVAVKRDANRQLRCFGAILLKSNLRATDKLGTGQEFLSDCRNHLKL